jgi:cytochrome c553
MPIRWLGAAWHDFSGGSWKLALRRLAFVGALAGMVGVAVIASGRTSIAADQGHWWSTRKFLEIVMTHTVQMRSMGTRVPPLDDPAMVMKGAGHYATGCVPCHGAPGQPQSLIVRQMVPEPPYLIDELDQWEPAEMHWIVKHGLKYTSMPAWPSQQRDDEVWAIVAFLRRLPELDEAGFRTLAYGPLADRRPGGGGAHLSSLVTPPQNTLDNCARCHGLNGEGRGNSAFPKLAGQREAYLLASLRAYARGARHSGVMQPIAAGLDDAQMRGLARHYAGLGRGLPALPIGAQASHSPVALAAASDTEGSKPAPAATDSPRRGAVLAARGVGERRIPACRHCHGPDALDRNPHYPDLAGQYEGYLQLQLHLFQKDRRGGTPYRHVMHQAAQSLSEQEIRDLAAFYASAGR